jgi:NADPH:quinone reductase-like Zn-dependent oxidoreductase
MDVDRPAPADDDVLVRVRASSANPVDLFPTSRAGYVMSGRKPLVLGTDFAGIVDSVGKTVTKFQPGDEVFGGGRAAFAEFKTVPADGALARKPEGVSFEQAGTLAVAATTALQAVRDHGQIQPGQKVLVNGASGGVGTFAVQIARALGADVTAVCSPRNADLVSSIGAGRVIDYTREDFTRDGATYNLVLDIAGSHPWSECARVLERDGTFVGVGLAALQHGPGGGIRALRHVAGVRVGSLLGSRRAVALFLAKLNRADLDFIAELVASGNVRPAIERTYSLPEAVEALRYLDQGHAKAKLAIDLEAV